MAKANKTSKERVDVNKIITDNILASLRNGVAPWARNWASEARMLPYSGDSKKAYKGINMLILSQAEMAKNYENSDWMTFNKINSLGGNVKKGESSTQVVFFSMIPKVEGKTIKRDQEQQMLSEGRRNDINYIPALNRAWVFNRDQAEGLPEISDVELEMKKARKAEIESSSMVQKIGQLYKLHNARPVVNAEVSYDRANDVIRMPNNSSFESPEAYAQVYLHQLARWTGHESRLNRDFSDSFENPKQAEAFEEMVSELTGAFICAEMGIDANLQHPEYISSWIGILENDEKAFYKAAKTAQKAADFLMEPVRALKQAEEPKAEEEDEDQPSMSM